MKEKIIEHRDQAYLSRQLIDLKSDVPIPEQLDSYLLQQGDDEQLAEIYTELEFLKPVKRN